MSINRICQRFGIVIVLFMLFVVFIFILPAQILANKATEASFTPQSVNAVPAVVFPNGLEAGIQTWNSTEILANVPAGSVTGNVFVEADTGASNVVSYTVGSAVIPDGSGEGTSWTTTFSGVIDTNTVWNQNILLTGDVTVNSGVSLTIEPGVTVFFAANSDDQADGLWTDKVELHVYGSFMAVGNETNAIYFTSNVAEKAVGNWGSIVIHKNSGVVSLSHCVIRYAQNGVYFWNDLDRGGVISGNVENCMITDNFIGIDAWTRPEYGTTLNTDFTIINNYIENNTDFGIRIRNPNGNGISNLTATIENNIIASNGEGIQVIGYSWWLGHTDTNPIIRNNTIENNQSYGVNIQANGSGDSSSSDTDVQPIIENNLIQNNGTNIYIFLDPQGSEGTQILKPMIQYNTIRNAATGILIADAELYDTLEPTIAYNVFSGLSGYVIDNTTGRSIVAEQNYWGSNPTNWDAGAQTDDVNGTVSVVNHLTSASPPVLSRMSPGTAMVGDAIQIHGANFGEIIEVFLPLIMNIPDEPGINFPIFIGDPIASRPVNIQGEVFYSTTIDIPETIPETGQFFLSDDPDLLHQIVVDDEIVFLLNGEEIFVQTFSDGSTLPQLMLVEIPRSVMLSMAGQEVTVNYRDVYSGVVNATEIWLQYVP